MIRAPEQHNAAAELRDVAPSLLPLLLEATKEHGFEPDRHVLAELRGAASALR
jgi:hypothetical protein